MSYTNPYRAADQLRLKHRLPQHEEALATCARGLIGAAGDLVLDAQGLAAGDTAAKAQARALLGASLAIAGKGLLNLGAKIAGYSAGPTRIHVATFGDSVAAGLVPYVETMMRDIFGTAGYSLGRLGGAPSSGAAVVSNDFTRWINGDYISLPTTGIYPFGYNGAAVPVVADTFRVYYLREVGGGTFKVQSRLTSAGGVPGAWTDVAGHTSISGSNATQIGAVDSFTLTKGSYEIRVVGVSGTCNIVGAAMYDSTVSGAILSSLERSGFDLDEQAQTPAAILTPILADAQINLMIVHNKDAADLWTTYWPTLRARFRTAYAFTDFALCGSTPYNDAAATAVQVIANTTIEAFAALNGDAYVDLFGEWKDGARAFAAGLLDVDTVHATPLGYSHLTGCIVRQLGLDFAGLVNPYSVNYPSRTWPSLTAGQVSVIGAVGALNAYDRTPTTASDRVQLYMAARDGVLAWSDDTGNYPILRFKNDAGTIRVWPNSADTDFGTTALRWRLFASAFFLDRTITAAATVGAQPIHKPAGTVNFAAGATSLVVTNSLVTASSIILCQVRTNDATLKNVLCVAGAGSFTIFANAAATAETSVGFLVTN